MIIVSQNKISLINFENVNCIGLGKNNSKEILARLDFNEAHSLGEYKTEERAKAVLQEIVTAYKNWNDMKTGTIIRSSHPICEMPKE